MTIDPTTWQAGECLPGWRNSLSDPTSQGTQPFMTLDFTSSLYLGFRHNSESLRPWSWLTTGNPAALAEPAGSDSVAHQLANLQGCEQAVLARSTLHLFWDLFGLLAGERVAIFQDEGAYSMAQWGIERAACRGVPVHRFPHKDVEALRRLLKRPAAGRRPIVVADGVCTACGCSVPINSYYEAVQRAGGLLVIDDTQAIGILGTKLDRTTPYGSGGGGSLRLHSISGPGVIVISSLAKGFGVPLAVLAGSSVFVQKFKANSETRIHCSPPSTADLHAAEHALQSNRKHGDLLRLQLAERVQQFRIQLSKSGFSTEGGIFPLQTLGLPEGIQLENVYRGLRHLGILALLRRGCEGQTALSLIITARHSRQDIENAVQAITRVVAAQPQPEPELG